jgi:hypothetical protein
MTAAAGHPPHPGHQPSKPARSARVHRLKTWPESFAAISQGAKRVDLRWDDRDYRVGDTLVLNEYQPEHQRCTGRSAIRWVTHVQPGGRFGLEPGHVALSLSDQPAAGHGGAPC